MEEIAKTTDAGRASPQLNQEETWSNDGSEVADQGPAVVPNDGSDDPEGKFLWCGGKRRRWLLPLLALLAIVIVVAVPVSVANISKSESKAAVVPAFPTSEPTDVPTPSPSDLPSGVASLVPSGVPSLAPSGVPSSAPSTPAPTPSPTAMPTLAPSSAPTTPEPTPYPTQEFIPVNPVPKNPPRGYFNYDMNSKWGPKNWFRVDTSRHWTKEFGPNGFGPWKGHVTFNPANNICRSRSKQSPLTLARGTVECEATHEIRTECADHPLSDPEAFTKLILPHKLSIVAKRRDCLATTEAGIPTGKCKSGVRPPIADYPKYSSATSDYSDMHHYDIKIPGEHVVNGVEYDAEVQMFHTHLGDGRFSSLAVPIRATANDFNPEFQHILDEFQRVYDLHGAECAAKSRRLRGEQPLDDAAASTTPAYYYNLTETKKDRELQGFRSKGFDPYSTALMPDVYFYRYDGTITEPPCLAITWWVMDSPMLISVGQLAKLKRIMLTHVDSDCQKTSVHNADQSVARPVQRIVADIQNCKAGTYRPDILLGRGPGNVCKR